MPLVYLVFTHFHAKVSSALELSVDMFSAHFFDTKDIVAAMEEWNILQALIRCASSSSAKREACFCLL